MPAHVHPDCHQFSFIVSGHGQVEANDVRIDVNRGICVRIPAGVSHAWHNPGDEPLEYVEVKIPATGETDMIRYVKDLFPRFDDHQLGINI
jgi:mannose-6-phosphate isomerase-like protein (cupin superfamily)